MGISTLTAARILDDQQKGMLGEPNEIFHIMDYASNLVKLAESK